MKGKREEEPGLGLLFFCGICAADFLLREMRRPAWVLLFFCGIFAVAFLLIEMRESGAAPPHF